MVAVLFSIGLILYCSLLFQPNSNIAADFQEENNWTMMVYIYAGLSVLLLFPWFTESISQENCVQSLSWNCRPNTPESCAKLLCRKCALPSTNAICQPLLQEERQQAEVRQKKAIASNLNLQLRNLAEELSSCLENSSKDACITTSGCAWIKNSFCVPRSQVL